MGHLPHMRRSWVRPPKKHSRTQMIVGVLGTMGMNEFGAFINALLGSGGETSILESRLAMGEGCP